MSVAKMVKKKKDEQQRRMDEYERKEKARKKRLNSQEFSKEVDDIIQRFEAKAFNIKSPKKKVVDFIVDHKGSCMLSWEKEFFYSIKFYKEESSGRTSIKKSKKFNAWKKALEDKFGIEISIGRSYSYRERFETYDDEIYQGLKAHVYVREEDNE
jgi:hypothetical protein